MNLHSLTEIKRFTKIKDFQLRNHAQHAERNAKQSKETDPTDQQDRTDNQREKMKKFEYKVLIDESQNQTELRDLLCQLGEEGWELAGIKTSAATIGSQLIFKKEKPRDDFGQKPRFDKPRGNFGARPRFDKQDNNQTGQKRFGSAGPRFDKTRTFTPKDKSFSARKPSGDR